MPPQARGMPLAPRTPFIFPPETHWAPHYPPHQPGNPAQCSQLCSPRVLAVAKPPHGPASPPWLRTLLFPTYHSSSQPPACLSAAALGLSAGAGLCDLSGPRTLALRPRKRPGLYLLPQRNYQWLPLSPQVPQFRQSTPGSPGCGSRRGIQEVLGGTGTPWSLGDPVPGILPVRCLCGVELVEGPASGRLSGGSEGATRRASSERAARS